MTHDERKRHDHERRDPHEYERKLHVEIKRQAKADNKHHRPTHHRPESRVERVLNHGDVGGHARDERRGLEVIEVREAHLLHVLVLRSAKPCAEAIRSAGGVTCVELARDERESGAREHEHALAEYEVEVASSHAHIDDIGHEDGDDHLERALDDHQEHADDRVAAIGTKEADDAAELMHGMPPQEQRAG